MNVNWRALAPHVPLGPLRPEYVERADAPSESIAKWMIAGSSTVLVGGPAGIGKSTELARAAHFLRDDRVAMLVQLDRTENMRTMTSEEMIVAISRRVAHLANEVLHLHLSDALQQALAQDEMLAGTDIAGPFTAAPTVILTLLLSEVARKSRQGRVALLIDGLEKVTSPERAQALFGSLGELGESVDLAVVVPWHAAFGPRDDFTIRAGERFIPVRPLDVEGANGPSGRDFLRDVLLMRLQLPREALLPNGIVSSFRAPLEAFRESVGARAQLVSDAAGMSGGVPRIFLQLMADAATYARLRGRDGWPIAEDLADAGADQTDSFRRLLLPGDQQEIAAAAGTDGTELALDRKVRLMAHGILLERGRGRTALLEVHPLVRSSFTPH